VIATVYGIGAGPGDPSLLTLRAARVLREVSLLVAPRSAGDRGSVALQIVSGHLSPDCEVFEAIFPMSEDPGDRARAAEDAAMFMAQAAREDRTVGFVTLGDAMLYSTWGYVLRALRRDHPDVPVETVPGVTSFSACAATLGEPLAEGRDALLVWPDTPPSDIGPLLDVAPNIVALKAGRNLTELVDAADAVEASVSAVQRCGMEREVVATDARDLLGRDVEYFTTAFVKRKGAR